MILTQHKGARSCHILGALHSHKHSTPCLFFPQPSYGESRYEKRLGLV